LTPAQHKIGLIVYPLLQLDPVDGGCIAALLAGRTLSLKLRVDLKINCSDKW